MTDEQKSKWVQALRSGKYKQAKGYYGHKGGGCHCTLGVLIVEDETGELDRCWHVITLCDKAGITIPQWHEIVDRNDGKNGYESHTFDQMADWIEANL